MLRYWCYKANSTICTSTRYTIRCSRKPKYQEVWCGVYRELYCQRGYWEPASQGHNGEARSRYFKSPATSSGLVHDTAGSVNVSWIWGDGWQIPGDIGWTWTDRWVVQTLYSNRALLDLHADMISVSIVSCACWKWPCWRMLRFVRVVGWIVEERVFGDLTEAVLCSRVESRSVRQSGRTKR